jgi:DNA-directed RNA polymerase specialized sigma24 family protein
MVEIGTEELAVDWVTANKRCLLRRARRYLRYAPYDLEDFLQEAFLAAIEAFRIRQAKGDLATPFPAYFWVLYKARLASVVPFPTSAKKGASCRSIPGTWAVPAEDVLENIPSPHSDPSVDLPPLAIASLRACTPRARTALMLHLGFGDQGRMTPGDIGRELGISRQAATQAIHTALHQVRRAANCANNFGHSGEPHRTEKVRRHQA